jgi:hypothetical protein
MQALRTEMVLTMEELGIKIEAHHHEVATDRIARVDPVVNAVKAGHQHRGEGQE